MNLHCVSPWSEARAIARCLRRLSRPRCLRTARPKCPYPLGPGRSQHRLCSTPHQGEEQPARGQDASGTVAFQDERCLFSLLLARLLACGRSRVLFCDGRLLTLAKAPCGHPQSDEARATGDKPTHTRLGPTNGDVRRLCSQPASARSERQTCEENWGGARTCKQGRDDRGTSGRWIRWGHRFGCLADLLQHFRRLRFDSLRRAEQIAVQARPTRRHSSAGALWSAWRHRRFG